MNVDGELYAIVDFEKTGTGTRITLMLRLTSSAEDSGGIMPSDARESAEQAIMRLAQSVEGAGEAPEDEPYRLVQDLAVSSDAAWSAWNDPARAFEWWNSEGAANSTVVQSLRSGGVRVLTWPGRSGAEHLDRMVFETVDAPHRLPYALYSKRDGDGRLEYHARVDFAPAEHGDKSRVTMAFFAGRGSGDRHAYSRAIEDAEERLGRFAAMLQLDA